MFNQINEILFTIYSKSNVYYHMLSVCITIIIDHLLYILLQYLFILLKIQFIIIKLITVHLFYYLISHVHFVRICVLNHSEFFYKQNSFLLALFRLKQDVYENKFKVKKNKPHIIGLFFFT